MMKLLIAAAAFGLAASAQAQGSAAANTGQDERIVTGSKIERPELESHEGLNFADQPALMAVIADLPRDEKFPARNRQLLVPSHGVGMNALFFLAAGEGPKPTMLLLHGLPGNERNLDLAQAVRRAGWNVLTFTYRGAWGSPGTFSVANAIEDAGSAIAFLRSAETARAYNVDPRRLVITGHSMGGFAAAATVANDDSHTPGPRHPLAGLVLLDAADMSRRAVRLKTGGAKARADFIADFDDVGHSLGPVTAAHLADEFARIGERWSLGALARSPALVRTPTLTLYATHGIREDNRAFADLLKRQQEARVKAVELNSDHSFADKRITLASEVVRWLEALPRP